MKTLVLLLIALPVFAATHSRKWESGILEEEHRENVGAIGWVATEHYTLDTGETIIVCWERLSGLVKAAAPIDVPVGHAIRFARISGSKLVLLDDKGKEHKVTIEQERQR